MSLVNALGLNGPEDPTPVQNNPAIITLVKTDEQGNVIGEQTTYNRKAINEYLKWLNAKKLDKFSVENGNVVVGDSSGNPTDSAVNLEQLARIDQDNTFIGNINNFINGKTLLVPDLTQKTNPDGREAVNVDYLDDRIGDLDSTDIAYKTKSNVFTNSNTFEGSVTIANTPANDTDAANKKYVDDSINPVVNRVDSLEQNGTFVGAYSISQLNTPNASTNIITVAANDLGELLSDYGFGTFTENDFITVNDAKYWVSDSGIRSTTPVSGYTETTGPVKYVGKISGNNVVFYPQLILNVDATGKQDIINVQEGNIVIGDYEDRPIDSGVNLDDVALKSKMNVFTHINEFNGESLLVPELRGKEATDDREAVNKGYLDEIVDSIGGVTEKQAQLQRLIKLSDNNLHTGLGSYRRCTTKHWWRGDEVTTIAPTDSGWVEISVNDEVSEGLSSNLQAAAGYWTTVYEWFNDTEGKAYADYGKTIKMGVDVNLNIGASVDVNETIIQIPSFGSDPLNLNDIQNTDDIGIVSSTSNMEWKNISNNVCSLRIVAWKLTSNVYYLLKKSAQLKKAIRDVQTAQAGGWDFIPLDSDLNI